MDELSAPQTPHLKLQTFFWLFSVAVSSIAAVKLFGRVQALVPLNGCAVAEFLDSNESSSDLQSAAAGDAQALGRLLDEHRDRLRRMVRLRMDRRLQGRIDPSDVIQDAYAEATTRFDEYAQNQAMPFFLWLRFLTGQRLMALHRRHLGAQARDASREVSIHRGTFPEATSAALAAQLIGRHTSPSEAILRDEIRLRLQEALNAMDIRDREILALRHFERLTNIEAARELDLDPSAASKRYIRAVRRLRKTLAGIPGGIDLLV